MAPEVSGEAARRGGVVGCRALLFLRGYRVEETFRSQGIAKYHDIGSGRVLRNRLK